MVKCCPFHVNYGTRQGEDVPLRHAGPMSPKCQPLRSLFRLWCHCCTSFSLFVKGKTSGFGENWRSWAKSGVAAFSLSCLYISKSSMISLFQAFLSFLAETKVEKQRHCSPSFAAVKTLGAFGTELDLFMCITEGITSMIRLYMLLAPANVLEFSGRGTKQYKIKIFVEAGQVLQSQSH